jgi:hypothetical protein
MHSLSERKTARLVCGLSTIILAAVLSVPRVTEAQTLYGSIVGNVRDASGATIPGAAISATNRGTNVSRQVTTDESGSYIFNDLSTGTYSVKVTQQGFKTFEQTEVTVALNTVIRLDVVLQIGEMNQTVTITGELPTLQTDTSEVHADLKASELENLPVPMGRNYQQVYRMLPGFSPPHDSHSIPTNPARALEFNVNGSSDNQNNTRVDGVSTYNVFVPHVVSYVPTLESLQEVNVVSNSFSAEQGFAGGAAINLQTKSGTNQIHGSLFEYHSDSHLKAWPMRFADAALNTGDKPKLIDNQFGGTVGGPIKKDKLFYFVSFEGTYNRRSVQTLARVPTSAMKNGDFSASDTPIYDPLTGNPDGSDRQQFYVSPNDPNYALCDRTANPQCLNILPASRMDPIVRKITSLIPDPNLTGTSRNYFVSGPFSFDRNQVDAKLDWFATSKLNFTGTFGVLHFDDHTPTVFGEKLVGDPIGGSSNPGHGHGNTYRLTVLGTYAFTSNFLVDAHFGWARQANASEQPGLGTNVGLEYLGIPGTNGTRQFETGWPEFDVDGFNSYGITNNFMPYFRRDPQQQYVANLNWTKGTHNIRFGTDIYHQSVNHAQAEFTGTYGAQGGFNFGRGVTLRCEEITEDGTCNSVSDDSRYNSFAAFVLGLPDQRGTTLQVPDVYHIQAWLFSWYARDRWTVTPKLTLDYGIRWEYFPVPTRPDRGIERYDTETGKVLVCGVGSVPKDCGTQVSKRLFAPRVGLAYRLTNTFVLRAGYGITNDPYEPLNGSRANYPLLIALDQRNFKGDLFPVSTLASGIPRVTPPDQGSGIIDIPSDVGFVSLPRKINRGYVQSWNLTLQKELKYGFVGQLSYVATRQVRMMSEYFDINAGQVIGAGDAGKPLYQRFGRVGVTQMWLPVGTGTYDSMQASLQRRFSHGLALTVNYTWGKAINVIDNTDYTPNIQAQQYLYLNRAVTGFDRTHNVGITNIWELPFGKERRWLSNRGVVSAIVSGWQVNSLISLMSGPRFSVFADGTALNLPGSSQQADQVKANVTKLGGIGDTPYYDPTAFADVSEARFGTSGFNILRGPGIVNWDFGVFREFKISERLQLQFRMESFNFTNTPHFDIPDNYVGDGPDFMKITSVTNLGRDGIDERQFRFGLRLGF